jgi:hypothetical protein
MNAIRANKEALIGANKGVDLEVNREAKIVI